MQRKCVVASAGLHLLLGLILLVGPAFLSSKDKYQDVPIIDFVPVKTVDALISGGGNPRGQLPPPMPAPQPQLPQPQPAPPPLPAPVVKPQAMVQPEPPARDEKEKSDESVEVNKGRRKIEVSTKPVRRNPNAAGSNRTASQAREAAAARQRAAIAAAAAGIRTGVAPSTSIELKGPGGGGVPYANFLSAVRTVYMNAWLVPQGITDDSATVRVEVTIARDGRVVSSSIINRSGNPAVDQSVEDVLRRVSYAAPLPDSAQEDRRTVTIVFDVKTKLLG